MKRFFTAALFFLLLVGVWHFLVQREIWNPILLPSPMNVGKYLVEGLQNGDILTALVVTMKRLLITRTSCP